MEKRLVEFQYYGISPFEVEVIFSILNKRFHINEQPLHDNYEDNFLTSVGIDFSVPFTEEFFEILTMEGWFKIKGLFKEIKRRRGRKGAHVTFRFHHSDSTIPSIIFELINLRDRTFEMAIEKIEYMTDIITIQIQNSPQGTSQIIYYFSDITFKWNPSIAITPAGNYQYINQSWVKIVDKNVDGSEKRNRQEI